MAADFSDLDMKIDIRIDDTGTAETMRDVLNLFKSMQNRLVSLMDITDRYSSKLQGLLGVTQRFNIEIEKPKDNMINRANDLDNSIKKLEPTFKRVTKTLQGIHIKPAQIGSLDNMKLQLDEIDNSAKKVATGIARMQTEIRTSANATANALRGIDKAMKLEDTTGVEGNERAAMNERNAKRRSLERLANKYDVLTTASQQLVLSLQAEQKALGSARKELSSMISEKERLSDLEDRLNKNQINYRINRVRAGTEELQALYKERDALLKSGALDMPDLTTTATQAGKRGLLSQSKEQLMIFKQEMSQELDAVKSKYQSIVDELNAQGMGETQFEKARMQRAKETIGVLQAEIDKYETLEATVDRMILALRKESAAIGGVTEARREQIRESKLASQMDINTAIQTTSESAAQLRSVFENDSDRYSSLKSTVDALDQVSVGLLNAGVQAHKYQTAVIDLTEFKRRLTLSLKENEIAYASTKSQLSRLTTVTVDDTEATAAAKAQLQQEVAERLKQIEALKTLNIEVERTLGLTRRQSSTASMLSRGLNKTFSEMGNILRRNANAARYFVYTIQQIATATMRYLSTPMMALATLTLKYSAELEAQRKIFGILIQDMVKSEQVFREIIDYTARTPYAMGDLTKAAKDLLAYGIAADNVVDDLKRIGDLAMNDAKRLDNLSQAYGKVLARGTATMRELNSFTQAGVPIIQALRGVLGITDEAGNKFLSMARQGKISFGAVREAVKSMTDEGGQFYSMSEQLSTTLQGRFATFKDTLRLLGESTVQQVLPTITRLLEYAIAFAESLRYGNTELKEKIIQVAKWVIALGPALTILSRVSMLTLSLGKLMFNLATTPVRLLGMALSALAKTTVLTAGAVTLLQGAILGFTVVAAIAAVAAVVRGFQRVRETVDNAAESFRDFGDEQVRMNDILSKGKLSDVHQAVAVEYIMKQRGESLSLSLPDLYGNVDPDKRNSSIDVRSIVDQLVTAYIKENPDATFQEVLREIDTLTKRAQEVQERAGILADTLVEHWGTALDPFKNGIDLRAKTELTRALEFYTNSAHLAVDTLGHNLFEGDNSFVHTVASLISKEFAIDKNMFTGKNELRYIGDRTVEELTNYVNSLKEHGQAVTTELGETWLEILGLYAQAFTDPASNALEKAKQIFDSEYEQLKSDFLALGEEVAITPITGILAAFTKGLTGRTPSLQEIGLPMPLPPGDLIPHGEASEIPESRRVGGAVGKIVDIYMDQLFGTYEDPSDILQQTLATTAKVAGITTAFDKLATLSGDELEKALRDLPAIQAEVVRRAITSIDSGRDSELVATEVREFTSAFTVGLWENVAELTKDAISGDRTKHIKDNIISYITEFNVKTFNDLNNALSGKTMPSTEKGAKLRAKYAEDVVAGVSSALAAALTADGQGLTENSTIWDLFSGDASKMAMFDDVEKQMTIVDFITQSLGDAKAWDELAGILKQADDTDKKYTRIGATTSETIRETLNDLKTTLRLGDEVDSYIDQIIDAIAKKENIDEGTKAWDEYTKAIKKSSDAVTDGMREAFAGFREAELLADGKSPVDLLDAALGTSELERKTAEWRTTLAALDENLLPEVFKSGDLTGMTVLAQNYAKLELQAGKTVSGITALTGKLTEFTESVRDHGKTDRELLQAEITRVTNDANALQSLIDTYLGSTDADLQKLASDLQTLVSASDMEGIKKRLLSAFDTDILQKFGTELKNTLSSALLLPSALHKIELANQGFTDSTLESVSALMDMAEAINAVMQAGESHDQLLNRRFDGATMTEFMRLFGNDGLYRKMTDGTLDSVLGDLSDSEKKRVNELKTQGPDKIALAMASQFSGASLAAKQAMIDELKTDTGAWAAMQAGIDEYVKLTSVPTKTIGQRAESMTYGVLSSLAPTYDVEGALGLKKMLEVAENEDTVKELEKQLSELGKDAMEKIGIQMGVTFASGMLSGLSQLGEALVTGADGWSAFGDAAINAIGSIIDMLPQLFMSAGLKLLIADPWDAKGWGLLALGGVTAIAGGAAKGALSGDQVGSGTSRTNTTLTYSAKGNAFDRGYLINNLSAQSYANGINVSGELGTEAVLPLSRDSQGRLGVHLTGGALTNTGGGQADVAVAVPISINVQNNTGVEADVETYEYVDGNGQRQIELIINKVVSSGMATGKYDSAMGSRYGVRRRGVM